MTVAVAGVTLAPALERTAGLLCRQPRASFQQQPAGFDLVRSRPLPAVADMLADGIYGEQFQPDFARKLLKLERVGIGVRPPGVMPHGLCAHADQQCQCSRRLDRCAPSMKLCPGLTVTPASSEGPPIWSPRETACSHSKHLIA